MARRASGFVARVADGDNTAHQLREYLFVFRDIDMKRVEGSSALIGERTSSTPLEFHLGTAQCRPNCRARIGDGRATIWHSFMSIPNKFWLHRVTTKKYLAMFMARFRSRCEQGKKI